MCVCVCVGGVYVCVGVYLFLLHWSFDTPLCSTDTYVCCVCAIACDSVFSAYVSQCYVCGHHVSFALVQIKASVPLVVLCNSVCPCA